MNKDGNLLQDAEYWQSERTTAEQEGVHPAKFYKFCRATSQNESISLSHQAI